MNKIRIEIVNDEEQLEYINELALYAFETYPNRNRLKERNQLTKKHRADSKQLLLYENDIPVSTGSAHPMQQNIRGKIFEMSGIATIASRPQGRRKGYVNKIMLKLFELSKINKQPISTLHPFKESFYEKYGYVNLGLYSIIKLRTKSLKKVLLMDIKGDYVDYSVIDGFDLLDQFLQELLHKKHSMVKFHQLFFTQLKQKDYNIVFTVNNDQINGAIIYKIDNNESELKIFNYYYSDSNGKYLILKWLGLHIGHIDRIQMRISLYFGIINSLPDISYDLVYNYHPMARIIDISEMGGIDAGKGEFVLKLTDQYCPWNTGNWKLSSSNGKLEVNKTEEEEELSLTPHGLTSILYGNYNLDDFEYLSYGNIPQKMIRIIETVFPKLHANVNEDF